MKVWARYDSRERAYRALERQNDRFAVRLMPDPRYPDCPWALVLLDWPPRPEPEEDAW